MDVKGFVDELLDALAVTERFSRILVQAEGPIVGGYAYVQEDEDLFLRIYFNEATGTIAFALIEQQQRIWGIDFDNRRKWHLHPVGNPMDHVQIDRISVSDIVFRLEDVLVART